MFWLNYVPFANIPSLAEFQLNSQEQTVRVIDLYANADKIEFVC